MRGLRKGTWSKEEDQLLRRCIEKFGEGKWSQVPLRAGLNRCGKSCRLRWLDYLRPNIKRGDFEPDELDLIIRMHKLLGNRQVRQLICYLRWSLIAGRLPGRTANDIKNYYNTHLKKNSFFKYHTDQEEQVVMVENLDNNINDHCPRVPKRKCQLLLDINNVDDGNNVNLLKMKTKIIRPLPRRFSRGEWQWITNKALPENRTDNINSATAATTPNMDSSKRSTKFSEGIDDDHRTHYFNYDNDQEVDEGGNVADNNYWNSFYLDHNSGHMLGEEQDPYFIF
ncbi:hypothetical protein C5167_033238 [Papaver somniferum]|uniref:Uncharacterized protein n=1 Tax=Papaver somniferum TaxID=3469 RepID=A0A4Y7K9Q6_PAPSO|nr:hypothetical protein C5167_033238 [Papaver somniferum]